VLVPPAPDGVSEGELHATMMQETALNTGKAERYFMGKTLEVERVRESALARSGVEWRDAGQWRSGIGSVNRARRVCAQRLPNRRPVTEARR
jgi:hypothetical protein